MCTDGEMVVVPIRSRFLVDSSHSSSSYSFCPPCAPHQELQQSEISLAAGVEQMVGVSGSGRVSENRPFRIKLDRVPMEQYIHSFLYRVSGRLYHLERSEKHSQPT